MGVVGYVNDGPVPYGDSHEGLRLRGHRLGGMKNNHRLTIDVAEDGYEPRPQFGVTREIRRLADCALEPVGDPQRRVRSNQGAESIPIASIEPVDVETKFAISRPIPEAPAVVSTRWFGISCSPSTP